MRTRTSAHLPGFGGVAVRGPPGPHWTCTGSECGRGRPRTSRGSAASRCADLPVRNGLAPGRNADEDVRAPPGVRRRRGARTSRSALDLRRVGMRTRTSAHLPGFGGGRGARTSRSALGLRRVGMRTRTSAHLPGFGGVAVRGPPGPQWACTGSECGRGRPRTSRVSAASRCADLPVRIGLAPGRNADEDVRAPPGFRRRRGARTSRSALGFAPGRNADEDVRAPRRVRRRRGAWTSRSAIFAAL